MRSFSTCLFTLLVLFFLAALSAAQINAATAAAAEIPVSGSNISGSTISLRATSTMNVGPEMGGAFLSGSKCDADGNLYIRKFAMDRPLLGPVVKIDRDGRRTALFDPAAFSQLALDRADAFSPASDGGMYQIAQSGVLKPRIYVLHFSSDESAASPTRLDSDFEVYTFAVFTDGTFLLSGVQRDVRNKNDRGRNFTTVFSDDGRELAQLSFPQPQRGPQQEFQQETQGPAKAGAKSDASGPQKDARKDAQKVLGLYWKRPQRKPRVDLSECGGAFNTAT